MRDTGRRLWMITRSYAPDEGGVQTYAHEVANAYAALGWQVTLFAKSSAGPRRLRDGEVDVIDVGPGAKLSVYARLLVAMCRARLAGERAGIIHACTWRAALPALAFPRARLIVTVHGREVGRTGGIATPLMRAVFRRAERIVAVSEATRSLLVGRLPRLAAKCVVAWNGTTRRDAAVGPIGDPIERSRPRIFTLCRLVPRKNIVSAVAAAGTCARNGLSFEYRIAGRGPEAANVAAAIASGRLDGHITQLDYVASAEIGDLYATSDIFLHPQLSLEAGAEIEGFGITVADAMAHGLACIVGAEGGPAELVQDGVTGLVVDGRSVAAVADALERLLRQPAERARLGDNARRWAAESLCWTAHCRASAGAPR